MYGFGNIANMDQIPLELEFPIDGPYETKGTTTVHEVKQVEDRIHALADAHYIDQCLNGLLRSIQHQSVRY